MNRIACSVVALFLFLLGRGIAQVAESPPPSEVRGVWVHPYSFGSNRDTALGKRRLALDQYQRAGINTVMVLVKSTAGLLYFQSATGVRDTAFRWDFFGAFLR